MPRRIGTTLVPRNPVARLSQQHRGGAHQVSKTSQRRHSRHALENQLEDWREEVEFERSLLMEDDQAENDVLD